MFSTMERSSSWQVQQQQQQQQHEYANPERQQQSQSGWFPLQDAALAHSHPQQQQVVLRSADMYSTGEAIDGGRWVPSPPSDVYLHDGSRLASSRQSPSVQHPASAYHPPHPHGAYPSDVHEVGLPVTHAGAGYTWSNSDVRLSNPAPPMSHAMGPADQFEDQFIDRGHHYSMASPMTAMPKHNLNHPLYQHDSVIHHHHHHHPASRRKAKEISIGRWNSDEHKWFLKGLEMFQGPAWGEIARLIGTRTSTQVRTHAQKFFTKLARMNQTLPYFEAQIQKERTRLIAQGALGVNGSSVTPTSTSGFNFALTNLSPRKRVGSSPHPNLKRGDHDDGIGGGMTAAHYGAAAASSEYAMPKLGGYEDHADKTRVAASYYHAEDSTDIYKPKYDHSGGASPLLRKPRIFTGVGTGMSSLSPSDQAPPQHSASSYEVPPHPSLGYSTAMSTHPKEDFDSSRHFSTIDGSQINHPALPRDEMAYGMLHSSSSAVESGDPWGEDSSRQWMAAPSSSSSSHLDASSMGTGSSSSDLLDAESLPSMTKLLYRGGGGSVS